MSGFDPLAAFALQAVANAQAAMEEATLTLGALLTDFQAQLSVGDVLNATVLPPENGGDRILLLGQSMPAQLPPGINPGETIALQVTGFTNTAVLVRNLGSVDPQEPPPAAPELPEQSASAPQSAVLRSIPPQPPSQQPQQQPPAAPQTQSAPQSQSAPLPPSAPVAPPRELFVAASVRPTLSQPTVQRAGAQPPAPPAPAEVEARLIATRASTTIGNPSLTRQIPPRPPSPPSLPVQSAATRAFVERPQQTPQQTRTPATPEHALLARLRVPVTPTTIAAAKIVGRATQNVTASYEKLDALLSKLAPDSRTASLRSSLAFVARLDLRNTRALPEQIASYVSNVVTSAESKIAQIVRAWSDASARAEPQQHEQPHAQASPQSPQAPSARAQAAVQPFVAARTAERGTALANDVKTALLALVENPPAGSSPQTVQALRDALTATTAVQLNALTPDNNTAAAITIPLPAYFYQGGAPAQLRISRDAPGGKNALDPDNFHIAFVLDTKSLGTVAIDVQTVGRSVSVDVKTETPRSADRFRTSLGDLRSRLEAMHYRIASMAAGLASRAKRPQAPAQPPPQGHTSNVDMQA
jgi:Flagellar hook-length control protein FliK